MILKDISFQNPEENILYDDLLLALAEKNNEEYLRFWEAASYFVVLGRIGKEAEDTHTSFIKADHVPVLRRSSGGGTVLQGKGCLNYTLILSKEKTPQVYDLQKSYAYILGKIVMALSYLNIRAKFFPISDIALVEGRKKISGNAQKRGRRFILHHGTLLYDFDLKKIEKYLAMPKDIPEYRAERKHLDFVANIPCKLMDIKQAILREFPVSQQHGQLTTEERDLMNRLLMTKDVQTIFSNI